MKQTNLCEICKENPATLMVNSKLLCLDCYTKTKDYKNLTKDYKYPLSGI